MENAMIEKMRALEKNKTWEIIRLPKGKEIVGWKWVFTVKYSANGTLERYKVRLFVEGYTQMYGMDYVETFAHVAKLNTIRILLSLAVNHNWTSEYVDVKNAFLHDDLKEEIYMEPQPGFNQAFGTNYVCRLRKTIYGLRQSPREWFEKFGIVVKGLKFKQNVGDHTLFCQRSKENKVNILIAYVDDIIGI